MPGPEFASCWLKLGRAREHFQALKAELLAWRDSNPYCTRKESNPEKTRFALVLELTHEPYFDRWALLAGDCVHNLRSVLDNLVYAVAIRDTGMNPPPGAKTLQFPVADTEDEFKKLNYRIKCLSQSSQVCIEQTQPYNRVHHRLPPLLRLLTELDNTDKHRLLNVVFTNVLAAKISVTTTGQPQTSTPDFKFHAGPIENGTEILHFTTAEPQHTLAYSFEVEIVASVSHSVGLSGTTFTELAYVLELLTTEVEQIVELFSV